MTVKIQRNLSTYERKGKVELILNNAGKSRNV